MTKCCKPNPRYGTYDATQNRYVAAITVQNGYVEALHNRINFSRFCLIQKSVATLCDRKNYELRTWRLKLGMMRFCNITEKKIARFHSNQKRFRDLPRFRKINVTIISTQNKNNAALRGRQNSAQFCSTQKTSFKKQFKAN